jgi:ATP-dependent protease ClpP protease subunit
MQPVNTIKTMMEPLGYKYTINLDTEIGEASLFEEELLTIRKAQAGDQVHILISTPGGSAETMKCFLSAMEQTEAHIITEITGDVASAGTFIFLAGHEYRVSDNAEGMFHFISFGSLGKGTDVKRHVDFTHRSAERLVKKYYKHFFTDDELQELIDGKEYWLDSEEIIERLEVRSAKMQEDYEDSEQEYQAALQKELFGEPLPVEALETLDKETLIRVIRGDLSEEEENELFGDHLSGMFEDEGDYEEDCVDESFDNQEQIDEVIQTQVITYLKQVADENDIKYAKNIGIETLRKRILEFFED